MSLVPRIPPMPVLSPDWVEALYSAARGLAPPSALEALLDRLEART